MKTYKVESISGFLKYEVFYTEVLTSEVSLDENLAVSVVTPTPKVKKVTNKSYSDQ